MATAAAWLLAVLRAIGAVLGFLLRHWEAVLIAAACLIVWLWLRGFFEPDPLREWFDATPTAAVDGDTLLVRRVFGTETYHLDGCDAPELRQAYGPEARQQLSSLTVGQRCLLGRFEGAPDRVLVQLPDGRDLGMLLVGQGFAWATCDQYRAAEKAARAAKRGLWVDPDPVPPWDFWETKR